ncbi:MAG: glycosyltransferase family 8 protein [Janthinobacterium lividum]
MIPSPIHLAAAFDQNYVTPFYVLVTSIFHNNPANRFHIHSIATGVSEQEREEIRQYVQRHDSAISFYELTPGSLKGLIEPKQSYLSLAAYYRLFFPALVPADVEKLLYLDTDIVVVGNLAELYNTDLSGYPAGAIAEVSATKNRPDLGIYEIGTYFNSGVLLMNIPEWRKQRISERAIQFIHEFPEKIVWIDQDALNVAMMDNYVKLAAKFNVIPSDIPKGLPKSKYLEFLKDKTIIHYTLKEHKPWNVRGKNKFRHLYHDYRKQSPRAHEKKYKDFQLTPGTVKTVIKVRVLEALLNYPTAVHIMSWLLVEDASNWL